MSPLGNTWENQRWQLATPIMPKEVFLHSPYHWAVQLMVMGCCWDQEKSQAQKAPGCYACVRPSPHSQPWEAAVAWGSPRGFTFSPLHRVRSGCLSAFYENKVFCLWVMVEQHIWHFTIWL